MDVSALFSDGKAHSKTTTNNMTRIVLESAVNIAMELEYDRFFCVVSSVNITKDSILISVGDISCIYHSISRFCIFIQRKYNIGGYNDFIFWCQRCSRL